MTLPALPDDRLRAAFEAAVGSVLPLLKAELAFYVQWECRVVAVVPATPAAAPPVPPMPSVLLSPVTVTCVPTNVQGVAILGPQVNLAVAADTGGNVSVPTVGSIIRVAFANADPTKPYIASLDPQVMPTVSLTQALRVLAVANSATWVGSTPFLSALGLVG